MTTNTILISITRYLHAKHDHEIDPNAANLPSLLKQVIEKSDDNVLHDYWHDYSKSIGNHQEQTPVLSNAHSVKISTKQRNIKEKTELSINSIKRRIQKYTKGRKI